MVSFAAFTFLFGFTIIQIQLDLSSEATDITYYSKLGADYTTVRVSRPRAKRFLFTRVMYTSKGIRTFQLERKLLVCGDIHSNPGPENNKLQAKTSWWGMWQNRQKEPRRHILYPMQHLVTRQFPQAVQTNFLNYYQQYPDIDWTRSSCSLSTLNDPFFCSRHKFNSRLQSKSKRISDNLELITRISSVVRLERRTKEGSSSTRIMRLVPAFIPETYNPTNNECLPKFVQTDNASSSIKMAIISKTFFTNTYSRTGKTTELILLFSALQNSGGNNSINTISLELCQWTYLRHSTPCHTN